VLDIRSPEFWDAARLDQDLRRVADVCGGCRRCLPLCPSFKALLHALDRDGVDGEAAKLPAADLDRVVDLCYQCKLCYNHCPYTPPHRWGIDFPRLMLRARAVTTRGRGGPTRRDLVLGDTERVGRLGSAAAPLANWLGARSFPRRAAEALLGIHRDRRLPRFHRPTFSRWFAGQPAPAPAPAGERPPPAVALFATCTVEYQAPAVGRAAVRVLRRNGVDVALPPPRCCGMPYLDGGAVEEACRLVDENLRVLGPLVRAGRSVVVPGPTCSYTMRQEWPGLAADRETARLVADRTRDLLEFLASLHAEDRLDTRFPHRPGRVAYQFPCHLRAQNLGRKSVDVLRLTGAAVTVIERCSAVDGTWGFKREYFELSMQLARPLFEDVVGARPDRVATDCPLAGLQIAQGTGLPVRHPVEILAEAYGLSGEA
jgi:Fe-S oxidoreductase